VRLGIPWGVLAAGAVVALASGCGGGSGVAPRTSPSSSIEGAGVNPADAFLSSYVAADGRVQRRDQGNDIVSEGQAYGMLIAELARRDDLVRTIWSWTERHLAGSDGLLAYHASSTGRTSITSPPRMRTHWRRMRCSGIGGGTRPPCMRRGSDWPPLC
jgi:hypothetical protein